MSVILQYDVSVWLIHLTRREMRQRVNVFDMLIIIRVVPFVFSYTHHNHFLSLFVYSCCSWVPHLSASYRRFWGFVLVAETTGSQLQRGVTIVDRVGRYEYIVCVWMFVSVVSVTHCVSFCVFIKYNLNSVDVNERCVCCVKKMYHLTSDYPFHCCTTATTRPKSMFQPNVIILYCVFHRQRCAWEERWHLPGWTGIFWSEIQITKQTGNEGTCVLFVMWNVVYVACVVGGLQ